MAKTGGAHGQIRAIIERNKRVEADKAWETSIARRAIIAIATYAFVDIFLLSINAPNPHINALIPPIAFVFSTLTLPFAKNFWLEKIYKK